MRKQGIGARRPVGGFQPGGKALTKGSWKFNAFRSGHAFLPVL